MKKTNEYWNEINDLVDIVQKRFEVEGKKIGYYGEHFINERFNYTIRLEPNGRLEIPRTVAQDFEHIKPTENQIERIMKSYQEK